MIIKISRCDLAIISNALYGYYLNYEKRIAELDKFNEKDSFYSEVVKLKEELNLAKLAVEVTYKRVFGADISHIKNKLDNRD